MKRNVVALTFATLSACSTIKQAPPSVENEKLSYQLYLSRSSMQGTDFEQYKLTPQGLFYECGIIHRGRPEVKSQGIQALEGDALQGTRELAQKISADLGTTQPPLFDPPGSNAGFADPGKFLLSLVIGDQAREVKTSLDGVEKARTRVEGHAKEFAESVRGSVTTSLCGSHDFYGIGRR